MMINKSLRYVLIQAIIYQNHSIASEIANNKTYSLADKTRKLDQNEEYAQQIVDKLIEETGHNE